MMDLIRNNKFRFGIIALIILLAVPITVILLNRQTSTRSSASGSPVAVEFSPLNQSFAANTDFTVGVVIKTATPVVSTFDIKLSYSQQVLDYKGFVVSSDFVTAVPPVVDETTGTIRIVGYKLTNDPFTDGGATIGTLTFQGIAAGSGTVGVSSEPKFTAPNEATFLPIDSANTKQGTYMITGQGVTATPTLTPTLTPEPALDCSATSGKPNGCECTDSFTGSTQCTSGKCAFDAATTAGRLVKHCSPEGQRFCPSTNTFVGTGTTCTAITATPTPTRKPKITKTPTLTGGQTVTTTITPTDVFIPTTSPAPGETRIVFSFTLPGIGLGKNTSPSSSRSVSVDLVNLNNTDYLTGITGPANYNAVSGRYDAYVILPDTVTTGNYFVKAKTGQTLKKLALGAPVVTHGQSNSVGVLDLASGDINGDNYVDLLDYNALNNCLSNNQGCSAATDLNSDGNTTNADLNILLRNFYSDKVKGD